MPEADHSFPLQFSQQHQEKIYFEKVELENSENERESCFVFYGQCMVLGDSRVGKTCLVKSLTGKEFDQNQTRTQGMHPSLVDKKWKYFHMTELIFGDLWKFFSSGTVQVLLIRTGEATSNVIVEEFALWKMELPWSLLVWVFYLVSILVMLALGDNYWFHVGSLLFFSMNYVPEIALFCSCNFARNQIRFTLATLSFIIRRRGLLIGSYLAAIICYWNRTYAVALRATLVYWGTATVIIFFVLFLVIGPSPLSVIDNKSFYLYPRRIIQNQLSMPFLCFIRLLLSISIGLICGFVALSLIDLSVRKHVQKALKEDNDIPIPPYRELVHYCVLHFLLNFPRSICYDLLCPSWTKWRPFDNWDKCGLISLVALLLFYHYKLTFTSTSFYFVLLFPLSICYTLYVELFYLHSTVAGNFETPNKLITLVTIKATEINRKMLKRALNEKFSSLKLKILDFAGDKEYYAYHHMFLRGHAIYLIVFNMAEFVKNDFEFINVAIRRLEFWIESVCSHVPPKTPIFLVGTHKGTIDENCTQTIDCHLKRHFWNSYCDELIVNDVQGWLFFPVENSNGENDYGIQCLQKKIVDVAEHCKETLGRDIPLPWVRIQDAIISHSEKKGVKFCVTLKEFPRAFENVVCTDWSKDTLTYFHEKGLVIYLNKNYDLDLSNWVLLKPEILIDIIIQLVAPPSQITQKRGLRHDWILLQGKGMLTKSLLKNIISKVQEDEAAMTAFLEEYDLICPLAYTKVKQSASDEQPTHFVPSLLPPSSEWDGQVWHYKATDKTFYVFFDRFLPEPLFHRLLSRAHKLSRVEFPNGKTFLFRDAGKFWFSARQPYSIKLMKEEKIIEVTFSCRSNHQRRPTDVLCQVFSMVDGVCKRNFPFVKFHCGPACPSLKCPGHQPDYVSYSTDEEQAPRRHVLNIMPGRQGDRIAFLYCESCSFEEELDEWVP